MTDQFRNFDNQSLPQQVHVLWSREEDDDRDGSPLDWMDEEEDAERIQEWRDGDWSLIGIRAKASIMVPIGGGSFCAYELSSAGLWGIESDSGEAYLQEVYEEEKASLIAAMASMGMAALAHQALAG